MQISQGFVVLLIPTGRPRVLRLAPMFTQHHSIEEMTRPYASSGRKRTHGPVARQTECSPLKKEKDDRPKSYFPQMGLGRAD